MADPREVDARPTKRPRLDSPPPSINSPPTFTTTTPSKAPLNSTTPNGKAAVDEDLVREVRAGIAEYVCPGNLGFRGVLKQRYTDFMVNEIGVDGRVVRLERLGVGKEGRDGVGKEESDGGKMREKDGETKERKSNVGMAEEDGKKKMLLVEEDGEGLVPIGQDKKVEAEIEGAGPKDDKKAEGKPEAEAPLSEEDQTTLHSIFGEQTTKEVISLVRSIRRHDHKKAKDFKAVIAPPITDKEIRTQAHRSLRRIFPNLLESSMEADQSIRIKAVPPKDRKGKKNDRGRNGRDGHDPERRRGQLGWEELGGEYLHFTLYKENKDTMEIVGFLGSQLGSGARALSFAGTKDKRACTTQRVCVKRQTAGRMNNFNRMLYNAAIGDFSYHNRDLKLGDLGGNEFNITLRDCHFQGEDGLGFSERVKLANNIVSKAITDFSEKGFINYYGLQRFGSFAASTDTVGLKLLQGNLKGAVEDLLAYTETALAAALSNGEHQSVLVSQDDRNRAKALYLWKTTGEASDALAILPKKFNAERNIIQHLGSRNGKSGIRDRKSDWQGALMCIPRNLRLMYVHAYQSLVWNTVAGKRWTTYGDKVVGGDLVLAHEHRDKEPKASVVPDQIIDQDGEIIINPAGADSALPDDDEFERARALTAEEAASGLYSIYDVVLPQPGFDVVYPENSIGNFYEEFMGSEQGGGLDPHKMQRSWREVSLSGGYRKLLAKPLGPLEFQVREYRRPEEQFVQTDLQRARGEEIGGGEGEGTVDAKEEGETDEGKKIAVVIKLQLGSSQYATIALRELCKAGGVRAFKPEFMGGR
ncbi:tRNA pseudouridine synthase D [Byssothecium circinans]|uniref:tRNA pseudouridine synthase D n=1 Tax=Byssothecium circinans TaxID=147558 RepID=A0A6A5TME6_9PLEO|nr:tRNA pseudouridine synthase D [Byssothecium circinans]